MAQLDFFALIAAGLTSRECGVLFWVNEGKRDAEIAMILAISAKTVGKHVENILRKLRVENRFNAAKSATDWLAQAD